jgi:hypothetical protein
MEEKKFMSLDCQIVLEEGETISVIIRVGEGG